ncbi:MAG: HlyD family secretion protein [Gemmatimonadota bacterium]|nr:HlyD family secretion protein [Gemmatimonadota bacterium]
MATAIDHTAADPLDEQPRTTNAAAPSSSKKRFVFPILGVFLLLALVWGVKKYLYSRGHESTDNAQVDGHIIPVLAKVGGYVSAAAVDENQHVTEGQLLVRLDSAEYSVRLASAVADLAAARAAAGGSGMVGQAAAQVAGASSQEAVVGAQITAARANQERALADYRRMQELASQQIVSQQQLDAARANAEASAANLQAVQRQSSAAGATVASAQAGVRLAQARLSSAQVAVENARLQLSYATIAAPTSGLISRKQVEVGQLVQPGQPLLSIVSDTGSWVTANFKETQLSSIRVGQKVDIDVDAYGGCLAEGKVESLSAATGAKFALLPPDNATGNFTKIVQRVPVRIAVTRGCGADRPLRPGMSVDAHVHTR